MDDCILEATSRRPIVDVADDTRETVRARRKPLQTRSFERPTRSAIEEMIILVHHNPGGVAVEVSQVGWIGHALAETVVYAHPTDPTDPDTRTFPICESAHTHVEHQPECGERAIIDESLRNS